MTPPLPRMIVAGMLATKVINVNGAKWPG